MAAFPDESLLELEFSGGVWTDVMADVMIDSHIRPRYGLFDMMPDRRTAGAGTMPFALNNSEENSAGLLGYYSPEHVNARAGFDLGTGARLWFARFQGLKDGTPSGVTLGAAGIGDGRDQVASLDGGDYIDIYSAALSQAFNWEAGAIVIVGKVSAAADWSDSTVRELIKLVNDANHYALLEKTATANQLRVAFKTAAISAQAEVSTAVDGRTDWFLVALTWSGSTINLYVLIDPYLIATVAAKATVSGSLTANDGEPEMRGAISCASTVSGTLVASEYKTSLAAVTTVSGTISGTTGVPLSGTVEATANVGGDLDGNLGRLTPAGCLIGAATKTPTDAWKGFEGHLGIWDTDLVETNLLSMWANRTDLFMQMQITERDNLIGQWPLWEDAGSTVVRNYEDSTYWKFLGKLSSVNPITGVKRQRRTLCAATSWLGAASIHKVNLLEVQEEIRSDQAILAIVENLRTQPNVTDLGVGQETFAYWGDDLKDERTTGLSALDKVNMSELGYLFERNGSMPGVLEYQNRHKRVKATTIDKTFTEADIIDMKVSRDQRKIKNYVSGIVYPRDVGISDETLYSMTKPLLVGANQVQTVRARFTDPDNRDVRLAGMQLNDPEGDNEISNRGAEDDSDGLSYDGGSGGSVEQSDEQVRVGTYSFKLISGTGASEKARMETALLSGFAQNDVVYYQAFIYVDEAWPEFKFRISEYSAADVWQADTVDEVVSTPTAGWYRVNGSLTVADADTTKLKMTIGCHSNQDFSTGSLIAYIDELYLIHDSLLNFEFSSADTGGGDKNDDLVLVDTLFGGNMAELVLENTSDLDGYADVNVRGRAVRIYDPVEQYVEDVDSQKKHNKRPLNLHLKYQNDPLVGSDWAGKILGERKDPETVLDTFKVVGHKSAALLDDVLQLEPGDRIDIPESVAAIDDEYFINGVEYDIEATDQGAAITAIYTPTLASTEAYWLLGISGSSECGITTVYGF